MPKKPVYGVGINDADYFVQPRISGVVLFCKYYTTWQNMLERCYSEKRHKINSTYRGCSCCVDWLTFSKFKAWMGNQDWHGNQLDKDLIVPGNKVYSPETCVFVSKKVNVFLADSAASRGKYLIGVDFLKSKGKFRARCGNPFNGVNEHIGLYRNESDAHEAWRNRKHELACQLADIQSDERVANALRLRYAS